MYHVEVSIIDGSPRLGGASISSILLQATEDEPDVLFNGSGVIFNNSLDESASLSISIPPSEPISLIACFNPPDQQSFIFSIYDTATRLPLYLGRLSELQGPGVEADWYSEGACDEPRVEIYRYQGDVQCEPDSGVALQHMQLILEDNAIPVLLAREGSDNLSRIQLCGSDAGTLNIYTIPERFLPQAEALGFSNLDDLALLP